MLPISVEPRAKTSVIFLQVPDFRSFSVIPPNCLRSRPVGTAAAVAASSAMAAVNFMFAVGDVLKSFVELDFSLSMDVANEGKFRANVTTNNSQCWVEERYEV